MPSVTQWVFIADIVATVAVIATLVYVAIQMRLTRLAYEAQGLYSSVELYSRWRTTLLQNSDVTRTIAKANRSEELDDHEAIQISTLMDDLFIAVVAAHMRTLKFQYDRSANIEYLAGILEANPGLIPHWNRFRSVAELVSRESAEDIDKRVNQIEQVRAGVA